jgi:hypothetical protein
MPALLMVTYRVPYPTCPRAGVEVRNQLTAFARAHVESAALTRTVFRFLDRLAPRCATFTLGMER